MEQTLQYPIDQSLIFEEVVLKKVLSGLALSLLLSATHHFAFAEGTQGSKSFTRPYVDYIQNLKHKNDIKTNHTSLTGFLQTNWFLTTPEAFFLGNDSSGNAHYRLYLPVNIPQRPLDVSVPNNPFHPRNYMNYLGRAKGYKQVDVDFVVLNMKDMSIPGMTTDKQKKDFILSELKQSVDDNQLSNDLNKPLLEIKHPVIKQLWPKEAQLKVEESIEKALAGKLTGGGHTVGAEISGNITQSEKYNYTLPQFSTFGGNSKFGGWRFYAAKKQLIIPMQYRLYADISVPNDAKGTPLDSVTLIVDSRYAIKKTMFKADWLWRDLIYEAPISLEPIFLNPQKTLPEELREANKPSFVDPPKKQEVEITVTKEFVKKQTENSKKPVIETKRVFVKKISPVKQDITIKSCEEDLENE